ncbi:MAG: hypothetical protein FWH29_02335 [Methanobrevibacter sp.]|nr:hypothetical protein [Methanobrevibacter sp.]
MNNSNENYQQTQEFDYFIEFIENRNIIPLEIKNKKEYYSDIRNIENSFTGIMKNDAPFIENSFILEASQLIINAIRLFELGYFDAAFYSLRQSIEISTTMAYLSDISEENRKKQVTAWEKQKWFPPQSKMLKMLKKNGEHYKDIKNKMSEFFDEMKNVSDKINKFVHKQGKYHFYTNIDRNTLIVSYLEKFECFLKKCISIIAIMRLTVDPFPILLMDKEIYNRTFKMITIPYTTAFAKKYIGNDYINQYKTTEVYKGYYNYFMKEEKRNYPTNEVVQNECIDTSKIDEILSQEHLLNQNEKIAVKIVKEYPTICTVYFNKHGFPYYITEVKSKNESGLNSSETIKKFHASEEKFNQNFNGAFASVFHFDDNYICLEHNEKLNKKDTIIIKKIIKDNLLSSSF